MPVQAAVNLQPMLFVHTQVDDDIVVTAAALTAVLLRAAVYCDDCLLPLSVLCTTHALCCSNACTL
jgi:hypothetical protein